ncbi:MAG: hypothetical protein RBT34_08185 [Anaerolineaceae bacterium]|nr:hypothetical protein [Anaerolineaceae bacterium]
MLGLTTGVSVRPTTTAASTTGVDNTDACIAVWVTANLSAWAGASTSTGTDGAPAWQPASKNKPTRQREPASQYLAMRSRLILIIVPMQQL